MMKRKSCFWCITITVVLFLIVGVPVAINEAYKTNCGYITLWGAPEVLSYYGTILGAAIAVVMLTVTIIFTRKQIQRDSYIQIEKINGKILKMLLKKY